MKQKIKQFVKNSTLPFLIWQSIRMLKQKQSALLTYSEIEAKISRQYKKFFGRELNWDNPETYNEKLHVSKLYMPSPEKTKLADKLAVREWIAEKVGSEYSVPLLGVYNSFDAINIDALPDKFVIKCNHDSGSYTLVKNKSKVNMKLLRLKYGFFMKRNYGLYGFEMHYMDIKPKILVEKFIDNAAVNDYRFFCFDGRPYYCAIDYYDNKHIRNARNIYDMDWKLQPFLLHYPNHIQETPRPKNFDAMREIAEKLCENFGHVRVDLYTAGEKIYFGEMTFTHANGFQDFIPDEWDYKLGALWPFDNTIRKKILSQKIKP